MSAKSLSPKLQEVLEKRIADRIRYSTNSETGLTNPFVFYLEGANALDKSVSPPKLMRKDAFLPPKTDVYDPYDKKKPIKIVRNVTSTDIRWDEDKAKEVDVETVDTVDFRQSCCYVQVNEINKLAYLMFGDGNVSKPKHLQRQGANPILRWEESKTTLHSGRERNEIGDIMLLAKALEIAKRADFTKQKNLLAEVSKNQIYGSYNPDGKDSTAISNDYFIFAKNYPRVFLSTDVDDKTKVEVLVTECIQKGYLVLDKINAQWKLSNGDTESKFLSYNPVTDIDPEKFLVKEMIDPKSAKLLSKLEYANKPRLHPYLPKESDVLEIS